MSPRNGEGLRGCFGRGVAMKKRVIGKCELHLCDCMELMALYPDKHFDLAIVDPPYGIGNDGTFGEKGKNNGRWPLRGKAFDDKAPGTEYFEKLFRVSKNQIIWGANNFISKMPFDSPAWIVWDKLKPETVSFAKCELAWSSFNTGASVFKFLWNGFCRGDDNSIYREHRIHPTQKPVALYKWLLAKYAKPGDKILDTHFGSGSIAVACNELGFELTASETDKDYFEAACDRVREANRQGKLNFGGAA